MMDRFYYKGYMQDQEENISKLQLDIIIDEIKSLNRVIWLLIYIAFFITLCFLKNTDLLEPQKYVIGALFLLFFSYIFMSPSSSSNIEDEFRWLIKLLLSLIISAIITILTNAVAYAFVWGYKYLQLSDKYQWYIEIFSSNWPK